MEMDGPLSLKQASAACVVNNRLNRYKGVVELPVTLKQYLATCIRGEVLVHEVEDQSWWIGRPLSDYASDLLRRYKHKRVFQCVICRVLCCDCCTVLDSVERRTVCVFEDADVPRCFCCNGHAFEDAYTIPQLYRYLRTRRGQPTTGVNRSPGYSGH